MDVLLAAVLGDLTTRSIKFFISNNFKPTSMDVEDHLLRILLQAQVIIDEAMRWQITNQAVLQQLDMRREAIISSTPSDTNITTKRRPEDHDFTVDDLAKFREVCEMKHQSLALNSNKLGRLLVVVELVGDLNDDAWNGLYSASIRHVPNGSKISHKQI